MSGEDWLLGDVGKKPQKKRDLAPNGIEVTPEQIEEVLADTASSGKRLRAGIDAAASQLEALKKVGLTGEALVLLVTAKCTRSKNGTRIGPETVQTVLEGLFRLGEYIR